MSLILSRLSRLRLLKPWLVVRRSSLLLLPSNDFSTSLMQNQTPPCEIIGAHWCEMKHGKHFGKLVVAFLNEGKTTSLDKKVSSEVVHNEFFPTTVLIGASHGWVATLNDDEEGILCLQDDLKPVVSDGDLKRIWLPPLVTLPHCQTQVVTNVAMSTSSPEDEDCVVAVKFLGPQLSFCRPAQSKPEWTNIRVENPCFFSSPVVFSKKDDIFRITGSGRHLIGSWDPCKPSDKPKLQMLRFLNLPKLPTAISEVMDSCSTTEHLMESESTGETFLVKWYKKTVKIDQGVAIMKTKCAMVFKLEEEGNAVYTQDIGDLSIFLSRHEPFCVPASSFPGLSPNAVYTMDVDESALVNLRSFPFIISTMHGVYRVPYLIPPQNID
ncbi:unnamed protein product [Microthlaspi erraticum]|uniref:KIB1-4 beta-propeller domain-containing protein n=1 Tax=Microthlaspi erraticum TaxID=1685480 RepID=A0A6D2HVJ9_9BRAS|nr:unnamed protein product [Microthlaspi erraticum]